MSLTEGRRGQQPRAAATGWSSRVDCSAALLLVADSQQQQQGSSGGEEEEHQLFGSDQTTGSDSTSTHMLSHTTTLWGVTAG